MRRLLWILLAVLTVALLVLVLQQNETALAELSRFDSASVETKIMAAALVGLIALMLFRQRFSHALESALIWVMLATLLALGYTYRFELREVADRVLAELIPGRPVTRGRAVEIARTSSGGFSVAAHVNGARVPMVLDTGASAVVLTQEAAKAAGLPLEVLNYNVGLDTANGRTRAASVVLDRLTVGSRTGKRIHYGLSGAA